MNRKPQEKLVNVVINRLAKEGIPLPISVDDLLPRLPPNPGHVIRELSAKGHLLNPELYDGRLPLGTARRLEKLGVVNRAKCREMLASGQLDLDSISYIGHKRRQVVIRWAKLNLEDNIRCNVRIKLPLRTARELRELTKSSDFAVLPPSAKQLVETVVSYVDGLPAPKSATTPPGRAKDATAGQRGGLMQNEAHHRTQQCA